MRGSFVLALLVGVSLLIPPTIRAGTLYLKNGEEIDCLSFRQKGDRVIALINRDTEVVFARDEVDLKMSCLTKQKVKAKRHKGRRHVGMVGKRKPRPAAAKEKTKPEEASGEEGGEKQADTK